jgi:hypothetical protein
MICSLVVAMMRPPSHTKALRELLAIPKWTVVHIALLAESNKQDQQLVPVGTKVVEVILPLFQGQRPHMSLLLHMQQIATSVVTTSGYFGEFCQPMAEINACQVICTKHAHGVYGSRDY